MEKQPRKNKKVREGLVISNRMKKTVVVEVARSVGHPLYRKVMKKSSRFKAHDEGNVCNIGDRVRIMETRPMSADKRWTVMQVIEKGRERIEEEDKGMPAPVRKAKEDDTNQIDA